MEPLIEMTVRVILARPYVFVRSGTTWSLQQKLSVLDGQAGDNFGISVSISEDYALVGAYYDDVNGANSGSAYVFMRSGTTWAQQAKLKPSDGSSGLRFGRSVSLSSSGTFALIGDYRNTFTGVGSAFFFSALWHNLDPDTKGIRFAKVIVDDFGHSVALGEDGKFGLVAAHADDNMFHDGGKVYIFMGNLCDASMAPNNGGVGDCTNSLASGSTCQPTCKSGYTVSGTSSCTAGTLTAATCSANPCDASAAPANGAAGDCTNSLASGSTCQPTCKSGYTVSGTSSCTAGTLTAATCSANPCDASAAPANGAAGDCTRLSGERMTCQPTCDSGYTLSGTRSCSAGTLTRHRVCGGTLATRPAPSPTALPDRDALQL